MLALMVATNIVKGESAVVPVRVESSRTETVNVNVPAGWDDPGSAAVPLIVVLHGTRSDPGFVETQVFNMKKASSSLNFSWVTPQAKNVGDYGNAFCATPDCCCGNRCSTLLPGPGAPRESSCDDSSDLDSDFMRDMILAILESVPNIDAQRVYVMGTSMGGFMAYRLACDHSDLIAAILAICSAPYQGSHFDDKCSPRHPVHTLAVHGVQDNLVPYMGKRNFASAEENIIRWAQKVNGCTGTSVAASPYLDTNRVYRGDSRLGWGGRLSLVVPQRFTDGCLAETELWSVDRTGHCPYMDSLNLYWLLDKSNIVVPEV